MNAKEARKQAEANRAIEDQLTRQRVRDHIQDEVKNGKFQVTVGYALPDFVKEELRSDGFILDYIPYKTTIYW